MSEYTAKAIASAALCAAAGAAEVFGRLGGITILFAVVGLHVIWRRA
jgi:hypothetical protein